MKSFRKLIPVLGSVLAAMLITGTASASATVNLPSGNKSTHCDGGGTGFGGLFNFSVIPCQVSDTGTGFSIQFIAVDFVSGSNGDQCLVLDSSGNTTTLQVDSQDSVTLSITQLCLKAPAADTAGNVAGSVNIKSLSGTNFTIGPSGAGTFSGTYGGASIYTTDIFFSFSQFTLDLVPVTPCTDPNGCNNNGGGGCTGPTCPAATPELDSLMLFGAGLLGTAGYFVQRRRAAKGDTRRHGKNSHRYP